jgi:hypothetical protein
MTVQAKIVPTPPPSALPRANVNIARPSVRSLVRACASIAIGALDRTPARSVAANEWRHDDGARWLLERAAGASMDISQAPGIVQTVMPDFVSTLATASAAAQIFKEGLMLTFDRAGKIAVPTLLGNPSYAAFVGEGGAIPVMQGKVEPLVFLVPYKLAVIVVLTEEMVRSSNIENLLRDALFRSAGLALDAVMFDSQPGDASRPPGLRYNVAPLTGSTAPDSTTALLNDIEALHNDIEAVTPTHPAIYVMSPTRAVMAELRSPHGLDPLVIIGCWAFHGTNVVAALAPDIIVSAFGDVPEIEASFEPAVQMDTVPTDINAATTATLSLWQSDCIAIKLRLPVTWALRSDVGLAWLTATNW